MLHTYMILLWLLCPSLIRAFSVVPLGAWRSSLKAGGLVKPLWATVPTDVERPFTTVTSSSGLDSTWECDDEAVCVEIPACTDDVCRTSLDVRIHNKWYDLSGWRSAHPAGSHWIDWYDGRDATEVMDGFHSEKGRKMYQRLPASKPDVVALLVETAPPDTTTQLNFRKLREELETSGWWERSMVHEYTQLGIWAALVMSAGVTSHANPVLQPVSCFLLALSMTAAGWLGHDYIHGVDAFAMKYRNFAAMAAGLAPIWWSDKHNKVRVALHFLYHFTFTLSPHLYSLASCFNK
jgi:acyl-lipid Delta6-acetylenase / acyl-lipid (9-3)-desaturase